MKRKYIDELEIKFENTPQGWCSCSDDRLSKWKRQKEEWGFDERETWALDYSFMLWLYERLRVYDEINIVNTSFHKFDYKDQVLSLQDCIDKMIEGSKIYLTIDKYDWTDENIEKINDTLQIFALCFHYLWW